MATKLQIFNRALGLLGQSSINNPENPESNGGKILANLYEQQRQGVLARYLWNFAEVTADTNRLGDSESLYDDDYLYPDKCLKLLKVMSDEGNRITDYRIGYNVAADTRVIQLDHEGAETLKLVYNYDVTNMFHWSPLAAEVFSYFLALAGCNAILGKENSMFEQLNKALSEELKDAIAVDGQEQPMRVEEIYSAEQARQGFTDFPLGIIDVNFP